MRRSFVPVLGAILLISILGGVLGGQTDTVGSRNLLGSDRVRYPNTGVTGTTLNKLAKLTGAPSTAIIAATTDTAGIIGIVVAGAGTTGSADIAYKGKAPCVFGAATTAGHYVINSAATGGDCADGGATYPTSGQVIGVVTSTNGGAGTYEVDLTLGQPQAGGGGGAVAYPTRATMWMDEILNTVGATSTIYVTLGIGGLSGQMYGWMSTSSDNADGDAFTNSFVLAAGTYTLAAFGFTQTYNGIIDWYIDGVLAVSGQDWYSSPVALNITKTASVTVSGNGRHVLKGVINGKNGSASEYSWSLTKVYLVPASDTSYIP